MSADCFVARSSTRALTAARSTCTADVGSRRRSQPNRSPSSPDPRTSVITSAVAIRVLDGTQSVSTAEPPSPSASTSVTVAARAGCRPAPPRSRPGPPPTITTRVTRRRILPPSPHAQVRGLVGAPLCAVRRLREQPRSRADGGTLPALARCAGPAGCPAGGSPSAARAGTARCRPWSRTQGGAGVRRALRRDRRRRRAALDSWESADSGLYRKVRVRVATLDGDRPPGSTCWTTSRAACRAPARSASWPTPPRRPAPRPTTSPSCATRPCSSGW